jgi:hypothetical protein
MQYAMCPVMRVAGAGATALPLVVRLFLAALAAGVLVFVVAFTISTRGCDR